MTKLIKDSEQRQRALAPDESFIVQAPAGSGKTELLIQRYLALLSRVEHPEEIVAITFTRKAAAEMQGRVITALERARASQTPFDDARQATDELATKVLEQDQKFEWQLEDNPSRLRIHTIDALCAYLTRQMPILSNFGAQPETVEDASELYQEAAANTLAELESGAAWSDAIAALLMHLDNDLPRIRNMLATMLARRDQWLRHVTKELPRDELESALKHIIESTLKAARHTFPDQFIDELLTCLRFAACNLEKDDNTSLIRHCLDIKKLAGDAAGDLSKWQGIVEFLFTGANKWRKQANKNIGFPAAGDNKTEGDTRKAMKERFTALLANLAENDSLYTVLLEVKNLPPVSYTDAEWHVINALCELLILADAQLRVLFSERNQVDFSSIEQAAKEALGHPDFPSDLALQLDYRIKHILVDEFQDISINQYDLLQQLTAGWSGDDGHTLFLVGDPMQSIYRFREAEVGLFLNTWQQQCLGQAALTPLTISVNFRSQPGIVDWINKSFEQILPEQADITRGAVSYEHATAFHEDGSTDAVQIHPILDRNEHMEAKIVLQLVHAAKQKKPNGTVAILVRNRSHLREIIPCLKQAGLRFQAVEIEALGQRPAIQDLLALSCALTHYADRIAWLAILRAPWCGLTLEDLLHLTDDGTDKTLWECMQSSCESLSKDGQKRLSKLREVFKQAFMEERRRPLRRWIQSVWIRIGGPATLEDETDLENVHTFFKLLDQFDQGGDLKNREQFIDQVSSLYAAPDVAANQQLQVMTIHKAKGLEFDTIILPGLSRGSGTDDTRLLLWTENPHESHQDLLLAPVKEAGKNESPIYDYVKRLEKEKQSYEEGRLLYVAATRAKEKLHLIGTVAVKGKDNELQLTKPRSNCLLSQLWPVIKEHYEQALNNYKNAEYQEEPGHIVIRDQLRRLTKDWELPAPPDAVAWAPDASVEQMEDTVKEIEYEWAGETIMHIGTVVHRCIQLIAEEGINVWDAVYIKSKLSWYQLLLKQLGVPEKELDWAGARVIEALSRMIEDDRGRWILASEHQEAQNEYAISGLYKGKLVSVVIDRTFIDADGTRCVIDYKTGRHEGQDIETFLDREQDRYQEQLEKYGALIKAMDERPVRFGLYFPLLQGWREWTHTE